MRRDGGVVGAVVRFTDISEQRRAAEGLRLLAETAVVDVVEDGAIRRVTASHTDERLTALFERARAFPPRLGDGGPQDEAIQTRRRVLVRDVDEAWMRKTER